MPNDLIIIGGGIVGLATAYRFTQRWPDKRVVVLEKEHSVALHQTGRNSGVIHSGIYYKPGSLKAINCRAGKLALEQFCEAEQIPFERCGKVIVATDESEVPALDRLLERGQLNGVECRRISREELIEREPHVRGVAALLVPETGIVDYLAVARKLAEKIVAAGSDVITGAKVTCLDQRTDEVIVHSTAGEFRAGRAVNCAGLYCDDVARMSGAKPETQIVPFRGEYFELSESASPLCRHLIYPVPDAKFPFLGVHFTRMIDGAGNNRTIECGPNAVLAFAKEGYEKSDLNLRELAASLTYPGFVKIALRHWRMGAGEMWRSVNKKAFVRALQKLIPEIEASDLTPAPAGVRAQAVLKDGTLVDDFLINQTGRVTNVLNAPSPAATASLNIGQTIVEGLEE